MNQSHLKSGNNGFNRFQGKLVSSWFGRGEPEEEVRAEVGFDIAAVYDGDGTQHEIAIGIARAKAIVGVLPGGTGNGLANELGTPNKLRPAPQANRGSTTLSETPSTRQPHRRRLRPIKRRKVHDICLTLYIGRLQVDYFQQPLYRNRIYPENVW